MFNLKKIPLFIFCIFFSLKGIAQQPLTIPQSALPTANTAWVNAIDTTLSNMYIDINPSNNFQNWNYSNLFIATIFDTTELVPASGMPGCSNFPTATAASLDKSTGNVIFYQKNGNGFNIGGMYLNMAGNYVAADMAPDNLIIPAPFGYNDYISFANQYIIHYTKNNIQYTKKQFMRKSFAPDAYGSLITPVAYYPNTLRIVQEQLTFDSTFINTTAGLVFLNSSVDSLISYNWYTDSSYPLVMSIELNDYNGFFFMKRAYYLHQITTGIAQIKQVNQQFSVYFNSSTRQLTVHNIQNNNGHYTIELYNTLGEIVFMSQFDVQNSSSSFTLSQLDKGIYIYKIYNDKNVSSGKFLNE